MAQWFRLYESILDDPKVQRLKPDLFKAWVNLLALACRRDGTLPSIKDMAFGLRVSEQKAEEWVSALVDCGLLDRDGDGYLPHNWASRQFKSDASAERMRRHRDRQRNVTSDVTVTPSESETEADTEQSSVPKGTDAPDAASVVFGQGLRWMTKATGKPEASCRPQLGKWRKAIGDAALIEVLGAAQREGPIDAMAWLEKAVASRTGGVPRKPWEKPPADALPTEEPWEARMKGWREKRFWMAATWGPPPGESGCRVPSQFRSAA